MASVGGHHALRLGGLGRGQGLHLLLRVVPADRAGVGPALAADRLQQVGPLVGRQHHIGLQAAADRLDQHDHLLVGAAALDGLAQHPAHRVAGGLGDQLLAGPKHDRGQEPRAGLERVEPPRLIVVEQGSVDVGVGVGVGPRAGVGRGHRRIAGRRRAAPDADGRGAGRRGVTGRRPAPPPARGPRAGWASAPWASGPRRRRRRPRAAATQGFASDAQGILRMRLIARDSTGMAVMKTPSGLALRSASFFGGSILVVNRPVQLTVLVLTPWSKVVSRHCT